MNKHYTTSLELSKQLYEAGATKDFESEFYWWKNDILLRRFEFTDENDKIPEYIKKDCYPALLSDELMELLPPQVKEPDEYKNLMITKWRGEKYGVGYGREDKYNQKHLPNALAKMLLELHKKELL